VMRGVGELQLLQKKGRGGRNVCVHTVDWLGRLCCGHHEIRGCTAVAKNGGVVESSRCPT
jgi:hypothetical protein